LDDGMKQGEIGGGEGWVGEIRFPGVNPMAVPTEGIDLSIVSDHSERMRQGPGGKCVGAVALMENGEGGLVGRILQIEIEAFELGAGEHALVDDNAGAEGGDVEGGRAIGMATVFDLIPTKEKGEFKRVIRKFFGVGPGNKKLFDEGGGECRFLAENPVVDRNHSPTQRNKTPFGNDFLGDFTDVGLGVGVFGWKKEKADPKIAFLIKTMAKFFDLSFKKFEGDLG